jgi:signal transduction histidine kinase/ActR/RegA family two-component response regulator
MTDGFAIDKVLELTNDDQKTLSLSGYFAVLEDKDLSLSPADLQKPAIASRFKSGQLTSEALSFGYTRSAYWLRLSLKNDSDLALMRMLEISEAGLTSVQFHLANADGSYQSFLTGRELPFSSRPYPNRFFVLPLTLPAQSLQTLYVRVMSVGPVSIPAKLWQPQAFYAHERSDYASQAWYFGMAMAMALFNLLLFIALRDAIYLLYVNFVTCMAFTLAIQNDLAKEFIWNDAPFWSNISTNVGYSLTLATLLVFTRRMLNTAYLIPKFDRLLKFFIVLFLLTPIGFSISLQTIIKPAALLYGVAAALILLTGVRCALKRQRSAYFFVAAFSMLCFAAIITVLRALGLVPTNLLTVNALQFGSALEMLLLAFALADRFNLIRREKENAQNENLETQRLLVKSLQSSERLLEQRVELRTAELDRKNAALRQAMHTLEDVERIARHDLKTPLVSLVAAPGLMRAGRVMGAQEEIVLNMIEHAARRALSMVNLSLDLYQMETGNYDFQPVSVDLSALLLDVTQDLMVHARSKSVSIQLSGHLPHVMVEGEDALCYSIIANLMKNAVEAAPQGSVVNAALEDGARVILRIHNMGVVPESMRESFFAKYSTSGKRGGTGLGTYSSSLLTTIQGGSLTMESSHESGTTLSMELTRAPPAALPVSVNESAHLAEVAQVGLHADVSGNHKVSSVLLVDDDEFNLMIMNEYIPQPEMSLVTALNGRLALDQVMKQRPDLIIMDIEMPIMGGIEALACIREFQRHAGQLASVIVAYSGNDDAQSHAAYLEHGFDLCLNKPSSRKDVSALLARVSLPVPEQPGAGERVVRSA